MQAKQAIFWFRNNIQKLFRNRKCSGTSVLAMLRLEAGPRRRPFCGGDRMAVVVRDSKRMIVGLVKGELCFAELERPLEVEKFPDEDIRCFAFGGDSFFLATPKLLKHCRSTVEASVQVPSIRDVCCDGTGALVATASSDRSARVFDSRRKLAATHRFRHDSVVTMVRMSKQFQLATADETFSVCIFDLRSSKKIRNLQCDARVADLAWYRDVLATASDDGKLKFSKEELYEPVSAIAADIDALYTAGSQKLKKWSTKDMSVQAMADIQEPVHIVIDGAEVFVLTLDGAILRFDKATLELRGTLLWGADDEILGCAFVGEHIVVASASS